MPFPRFDLIAEVIAALMWGPKSQKEMTEITGYNCQGVNHMLRALEASGVVYRHSTRPSTRGMPAQLYAMRLLPHHDPAEPIATPGKRVYLAGPMTGMPEMNFPAFHAAARALRGRGWDVVNPAEINPDPKAGWACCMRDDIAALVTCDTVAMLPGWERSRGARIEWFLGINLGLRVMSLDEVGSP